jgi:peroxiredoxin
MAMMAAVLISGCATQPRRTGPSEPVTKMKDFDYGLELTPFNGTTKKLADFRGKNISIYYLSSVCPHCHHAMPHIEKARKILDSLGYERVNICIKFNSDEQFTNFIREEKLTGACFKDSDRRFAGKYGTGSVPVFFVINGNGDVTRYNTVGDTLAEQVAEGLKTCCKD